MGPGVETDDRRGEVLRQESVSKRSVDMEIQLEVAVGRCYRRLVKSNCPGKPVNLLTRGRSHNRLCGGPPGHGLRTPC